jgi:hypothetical protein
MELPKKVHIENIRKNKSKTTKPQSVKKKQKKKTNLNN